MPCCVLCCVGVFVCSLMWVLACLCLYLWFVGRVYVCVCLLVCVLFVVRGVLVVGWMGVVCVGCSACA